MSGKRWGLETAIGRIAAWSLKPREAARRGHEMPEVVAALRAAGHSALASRLARAIVGEAIRCYIAVKPDMTPGSDPRTNQLLTYFNSLDRRRKSILARKLTYDRVLRSLCRPAASAGGTNGSNFSYLTAIALSIGGRCNLACPYCLMRRFQSPAWVDIKRLDYIFRQAENLGVSYVSIMGAGEPFLDRAYARDLLACIGRHAEIDVVVYTNGTTADEDLLRMAGDLLNLFVFVSLDGLEERHDRRKGQGAFASAVSTLRLLRKYRVPCGFSAVVDPDNYLELTSLEFIETLADAGALLGCYNQACSITPGGGRRLADAPAAAEEYRRRLDRASAAGPIYVIDMLALEQARYGCRAKKGTSCFIDAVSGKVSPCVLFPFASDDANIYDHPSESRLEEILRSEFFSNYRKERGQRRQCLEDISGELAGLLGNPLLGAGDRAEVEKLLEVVA